MKKNSILILGLMILYIRGFAAGGADPYSASISGWSLNPIGQVGIAYPITLNIGNGGSAYKPILPNSVNWTFNYDPTVCKLDDSGLPSNFTIVQNTPGAFVFTPNADIPPNTDITFNLYLTGIVADQLGNLSLNNGTQPGYGGEVGNLDNGNDNVGTVISFSPDVLPITLITFTISTKGCNSSNLIWSSATETDFGKYVVQRSKDGASFEDLATVLSKGSNSNYSYKDVQLSGVNGSVDYRLKMVDLDGSFKYSHVVSIAINKLCDIGTVLYPNPTTNTLNINFNWNAVGKYILTIQDVTGRQIKKTEIDGMQSLTYSMDVSGLSSGTYLLSISNENGIIDNKKFTKL